MSMFFYILAAQGESHTELEWLGKDAGQFLNTGVVPADDYSTVAEVEFSWQPIGNYAAIFTSYVSETAPWFRLIKNAGGSNAAIASAYSRVHSRATLLGDLTVFHTVRLERNMLTVNGVTQSASAPSGPCTAAITLFDALTLSARVKSFKISDSTGTRFDGVPVIKDGVACMYDRITKNYFYNQGTGEFLTNLD